MGKDFELPEGVYRGGDFFSPKGIEVKGEEYASRIRTEYEDTRADLLIIASESSYLELPSLTEDESPKVPVWVPRYDHITGDIYTSRWNKDATITQGNRRFVLEAEKFSVIYSKRSDVDLTDIPKSWVVAQLVPQQVIGGFESAIRQQRIVEHDYGKFEGAEQDVVTQLLVGVRGLADRFREEDVTRESLGVLSGEVGEYLVGLGIDSASSETRKHVFSSVMRAVGVDSMGRVNPMISRVLLRSAYLNAVRMEVVGRLSKQKSRNILSTLLVERELTREVLSDFLEGSEILVGFTGGYGDPFFMDTELVDNPELISDEDITNMRSNLHILARSTLRPVRASPYLVPARIAEAMLLDRKMMKARERIALEQTLGVVGLSGEKQNPSVEEYVMRRNPLNAAERFRQAHSVVFNSLNDPDNLVIDVF